jgi:hypothetical protein
MAEFGHFVKNLISKDKESENSVNDVKEKTSKAEKMPKVTAEKQKPSMTIPVIDEKSTEEEKNKCEDISERQKKICESPIHTKSS